MFGYIQPGFISTRPFGIGHGVNNIDNSFVPARPSNWFDKKNSHFSSGDSQKTFGWNLYQCSEFSVHFDWGKINVTLSLIL